MRKLLALSLGTLTLLLAGACGDAETGGSVPEACVDYSGVSGSPSFKDDVVPIFQLSCATASVCHQLDTVNPQEDLALGRPNSETLDQTQIDTVHASIVNVDSVRADMKLVVPGDPGASWLLAKSEYTSFVGCETITCSAKGCGARMPSNSPKLAESALDTLRAWIAAGALNN